MTNKAHIWLRRFLLMICSLVENSVKIKKGDRVVGYHVYDHKSHGPIILSDMRDQCAGQSADSREVMPRPEAETEQTEPRE